MAKAKRLTVYGKKVETGAQGRRTVSTKNDHKLDIHEEASTIKMPDGTQGPYGVPISTGAAVLLIKNFKEAMETKGFKLTLESTKDSVIEELLATLQGITFDKSQMLRIISQPGCEGMRFYPAARKKSDGSFDSFTLVCVGVDKDGYDLNYKSYKAKEVFTRGSDSCESIVDDWGHPPTITKEAFLSSKLKDEWYVLMRMAEQG